MERVVSQSESQLRGMVLIVFQCLKGYVTNDRLKLIRTEVEPSVAETVALMEVRWIDRKSQGVTQKGS